MIDNITIKNYRSILDASVSLSPFTLLIGANGTGKSNFLQLLKDTSAFLKENTQNFPKHINHPSSKQLIVFTNTNDQISVLIEDGVFEKFLFENRKVEIKNNSDFDIYLISELKDTFVYSLNPVNAGLQEPLVEKPVVNEDGSGVVQVLDSLKTGDREDLFNTIESTLSRFVPEIEKLSFIPKKSVKQLQVREKHIAEPVPVSQLSDGTRLVLIILTILFQEKPPSLICIEEIDHGLHPRLFGQIIDLCFDMAHMENMPQIIATTHNPYMVDHFKGNESAVVILEKEKGETTFTTLEERLNHLKSGDEAPLGELWYSGVVGGVPKRGA